MPVDIITDLDIEQPRGCCLNTFFCMVVGFLLVPFAVFILYQNEQRAVQVDRDLNAGSHQVVTVSASPVTHMLDGRLVYVVGPGTPARPVVDPRFGLKTNDLALRRDVEMYQWTESSTYEQVGPVRATTYSYRTEWSAEPVPSSSFRHPANHKNPPMPVQTTVLWADAHCGAYAIGPDLLHKLHDFRPVAPTRIPIRGRWKRTATGLYLGANPAEPHVGDLRVTFREIPTGPVSIVGGVRKGRLGSYTTPKHTSIAEIELGSHPAADLFHAAHVENVQQLWLVRLAGLVVMFLGFLLVGAPILAVADAIPVFGWILGDVDALVCFGLALMASLVTIAVGWIHARPLEGAILMGAAGLVLIATSLRGRRRRRSLAAR